MQSRKYMSLAAPAFGTSAHVAIENPLKASKLQEEDVSESDYEWFVKGHYSSYMRMRNVGLGSWAPRSECRIMSLCICDLDVHPRAIHYSSQRSIEIFARQYTRLKVPSKLDYSRH